MVIAGINNCYDILNIASNMLKAEIAAKKNDMVSAEKYFKTAVQLEDKTLYDEPPDWFFPVRHAYGAVLIDHGKYAEAEEVYREELKIYPNDPWSLFGLYQSLDKQSKPDEAAAAKKEFDEQWKYADFQLTSSRIL
jgi:tetratricopeptide (TPR) repeat protein